MRVWYSQESSESLYAFNQTNHQDLPHLLYSVTFKLALSSLLEQTKEQSKFLFLLYLSSSQELW